MNPLLAHPMPQGAAIFDNGSSVVLLPVISELGAAKNTIEAIGVMDHTPEHLYLPLVEVPTMKPQLFARAVVGEVLRIVGFARLHKAFGLTRGSNMIERFC
jgi:hypothetical protein